MDLSENGAGEKVVFHVATRSLMSSENVSFCERLLASQGQLVVDNLIYGVVRTARCNVQ